MKSDTTYLFDGKKGLKYINPKYNPSNYKRDLSNISEIIIHCTATDSLKWEDPICLIEYDKQPNHISRKGCPFATYHYYINKLGEIFHLIDMRYYTWHCKGRNQYSLAIAINHAGKKRNVTEAQINSLSETVIHIFEVLGWDIDEEGLQSKVKFHRDYANKLCPGKIEKPELYAKILERWAEQKR